MNDVIRDYVRELRSAFQRIGAKDAGILSQVVADHLEEQCKSLMVAQDTSWDEAAMDIVDAWGPARDVQVSYTLDEVFLKDANGETLLSVPNSAMKRGGGPMVVRIVAIVVLTFLVVAGLAAAVVLVLGPDYIDQFGGDRPESPEFILGYESQSALTEPRVGMETQPFTVQTNGTFRFIQDVRTEFGCVQIQITDPDGNTMPPPPATCAEGRAEFDLQGVGQWEFQLTFIAFAGFVSLDAFTVPSE